MQGRKTRGVGTGVSPVSVRQQSDQKESLLTEEVAKLRSRNAELMHLQSQFSAQNMHLSNKNEDLQVS